MATDSFVHLHLHTEYSLLDGSVRIDSLMKKAKEYEMPAVAMTDHGNLFGAIEFYQTAEKYGVKPIIGCEVYLAPGAMTERKATSGRDAASHFTLLAQDDIGYHNLIKLVSAAYLDGFYYKPRIDKELLAKHATGLVAMSGCLKGEINLAIQRDDLESARRSIGAFCDIFGKERFFLELHDHGIDAQMKCNRVLKAFSKEFGLGLVAANDVHFLERSHHEAHDVMICIGTGSMVHDEKRMHYSPELYFKNPQEMAHLFRETPEALRNTLRIAEMCNLEMQFGKARYPEYDPPEGKTRSEYLRELCYEGLEDRYGSDARSKPDLIERLEYELSVIERTGFISYFLIVWDFINFARSKSIPVGPGRGSAAGSLIAYVLHITDIDPLEYGLIFERFLNPERVSPPDVDIDFCVKRRGEVIEYVRKKYGERSVAQIVTFGSMGAKSVIRDVGRVMGMSYGDADRIARMIPNELGITLNGKTQKDGTHAPGAIDKNQDLRNAVDNEPATKQLWEYASVLEGLSRNTGIHAAGVVISNEDLAEQIPIFRGSDNEVVTQFAMGPLTDVGMLKMDFLGLKNLTIINDTVQLIREKEPEFDLDKIPMDDAEAFAVINRGETIGLFQIESGGMVSMCKQFDVQNVGDIIALIALYRPGPMDLIPDYISRKKGKTKIKYEHPLLEQVSADTFGVLIYQEQVQRAANVLAGYSLGDADLLRRAMGKKDKEKMAKERERFIEGCAREHQIPSEKANTIFDVLEKFAGYGFNKSHSAAYGVICYRTAYLKARYPVEFMCGLLGNEVNNTDKIAVLVNECKRMNIPILPPDVNRSALKFVAEPMDGISAIRFGLAAIKNVGESAMESAIAERDANGAFKDLSDFCTRLDGRSVNRKILESLISCGAFDFTGRDRAELFAQVESTLAAAASAQKDRAIGQGSLFGDMDFASPAATVMESVSYEPWTREQKLASEKELLGFYVTGHPLDNYRETFSEAGYTQIANLAEVENKSHVTIAGILNAVEKKFTKKEGKPFAILQIEDLTGSLEVTVWSETFTKSNHHLIVGNVVAVTGRIGGGRDESTLRLSASEVSPVQAGTSQNPILLRFEKERGTTEEQVEIRKLLLQYPGVRPVDFEFILEDDRHIRIRTGDAFRVELTDDLRRGLAPWIPI